MKPIRLSKFIFAAIAFILMPISGGTAISPRIPQDIPPDFRDLWSNFKYDEVFSAFLANHKELSRRSGKERVLVASYVVGSLVAMGDLYNAERFARGYTDASIVEKFFVHRLNLAVMYADLANIYLYKSEFSQSLSFADKAIGLLRTDRIDERPWVIDLFVTHEIAKQLSGDKAPSRVRENAICKREIGLAIQIHCDSAALKKFLFLEEPDSKGSGGCAPHWIVEYRTIGSSIVAGIVSNYAPVSPKTAACFSALVRHFTEHENSDSPSVFANAMMKCIEICNLGEEETQKYSTRLREVIHGDDVASISTLEKFTEKFDD